MDDVRIDVVDDDAAGELLTVRRAAFVTEAQVYGDPNIPALTQTLPELRADLARAGGDVQAPRRMPFAGDAHECIVEAGYF